MNSIRADSLKTKYCNDVHLVICIDGQPLDQLISVHTPGSFAVEGLVPTLLDWLWDPRERAVVWSRTLPDFGGRATLPILRCPDDCDLGCTVVVTEVHVTETQVTWQRFGFDRPTPSDLAPHSVGDEVEWIAGVGPFTFSRMAYEKCLDMFRELHKSGTA